MDSRKILLTRGLVTELDSADFDRFSPEKWLAHDTGCGKIYAYRNQRLPGNRFKNIYLHRLILDAPTHLHVDHINGDTLDNRRSNLRLATQTQNNQNRRKSSNSHGFRGVARNGKRFVGVISAHGKAYRTRQCDTPADAALFRDLLAIQHHGEFAVLNFQFIPLQEAA